MESGKLNLRPIHLPDAIGWWPLAPGWWLLLVSLPLLLGFCYWLYRRMSQKTAIKTAKALLLQIKQNQQTDNSQKLKDLSALIRRVAINTCGRSECAGLTGRQWLEFLDRSVQGSPFSQGAGQLLANGPYQNTAPTEQEVTQLANLCEQWLNAQNKRRR